MHAQLEGLIHRCKSACSPTSIGPIPNGDCHRMQHRKARSAEWLEPLPDGSQRG